MKIHISLLIILFSASIPALSQDRPAKDSMYLHDTVRSTVNRFQNLSFGGYIQPQFQIAENKGIHSFEGGNFQKHADNRFMLRRSRVKIEYQLRNKSSMQPKALFSLQLDGTERGVNVRDAFIRWYGPGKRTLSLTAGLFNRPFGYEVFMSSSVRESPERARASQILTPGEKDLGVMLTLEPKSKFFSAFKFDIGIFNGQGTTGPTDFDSYKDVNARLWIKPIKLGESFSASAGISQLEGGWVQDSRYRYEIGEAAGANRFVVDSSMDNIGSKTRRRYNGVDVQLSWKHGMGKTELRSESWQGIQSGIASSTVSPGTLPTAPVYVREFSALFLYFIQNIVNEKWEAVVKYDYYDPNQDISEKEIGAAGSNFTAADIRYNTIGVGLTRYISGNLKMMAYYSMPKNESTSLAGFTSDIEDNVFTLRMQLKF